MSTIAACNVYWKTSPADLQKRSKQLCEKAVKVYDEIGGLSETGDEVNFKNVVQKLSLFEAENDTERNMLDFFQHVSADKELREASTIADKELSKLEVDLSMRKDVFDKFVALESKLDDSVTAECRRYVERKVKIGKRNGLHLSEEVRNEVKKILTRESDLGIDFSKNLGDENSILEFTREDLVGCCDEFLDTFEKTDSGLLKVSLKYPHYFPCMKKARNPETRRKLETAFNSRCMKENSCILEELVELREKRAKLLNFSTHADYVLEMRMAKSASKVKTFLEDLAVKLKPLLEKEMAVFTKYKKEECEKYGFPFSGKVDNWDVRYLMNLTEERDYAVDHDKLKDYFPMEKVTSGLFDIYQTLLGLTFTKVDTEDVWNPEVTIYKVTDTASSTILGYFYLDLHPREGKYGHAAVFSLQPSCSHLNGGRQVAVAAMVANFTRPTADKPALFLHDEVETFFHEFGHLMHQICAQSEYSLFAGTRVERDFVECPSQMLENWCWEAESLSKMSSHYKTGEPIPKELLDALLRSKTANAGVFNTRQVVLATFDQTIHSMAKVDSAKVYAEVFEKYLGIPSTPNTNMSASFGHLAGGYDAQYYGYLWSEVFSADMFMTRFKKEGVLNPKTGMDYRRYILQPGGSKDAKDMLHEFLGREPNEDAFLKMKGL